MGCFGGEGAGGSAEGEPLGGAGDAAPGAAAFGDAQGVVALLGERDGFGAFVDEVVLGGGEFGLTRFAIDGEVVEGLEVLRGDNGLCWRDCRGFVCRWRSGKQGDGRGERQCVGKVLDDLGRSDAVALLGCERGERLRELRVAIMLTRVGGNKELAGGGKFGGKLSAVADVGTPGEEQGDTKSHRDHNCHVAKVVVNRQR